MEIIEFYFLKEFLKEKELPPPQASVVAAGDVFEVVVENAGLAVEESDFHERETPHHGGILCFHHPPRTPLRVLAVNDPVPHFQV
jgi:hypothetical protein